MVTTADKQFMSSVRSTAVDLGMVGAILAFLTYMVATGRPGQLGVLMRDHLLGSFGFFVSISFLVAVAGIFLLEYLVPADPDQRGMSPNVLIDALYMLVHLPVISALTIYLSGPVNSFLSEHLSWAVIDFTRSWPLLLSAVLGMALIDLGVWWSHLIKHKVSWLWRFHMIHHSQRRMSLFTANRTHPVDALSEHVMMIIPLFFLFPSLIERVDAFLILSLFQGWQVRFQHANIGSNLGPLRYLFVTPQSHRIHHSTEPHHWNSNYANVFAWDRVFGTQHSDVTSYPTTGINDPYFPEPNSYKPTELATSFVGQMLFPLDGKAVRRASAGSQYDSGDTRAGAA